MGRGTKGHQTFQHPEGDCAQRSFKKAMTRSFFEKVKASTRNISLRDILDVFLFLHININDNLM